MIFFIKSEERLQKSRKPFTLPYRETPRRDTKCLEIKVPAYHRLQNEN